MKAAMKSRTGGGKRNQRPPSLRQHLPEIVAAIERYFPAEFQQALIEHLRTSITAAEGRGKSAVQRSRERSEHKRQAVRATATHLFGERPGLNPDEAVAIVYRRLQALHTPVSRETIRDELTKCGAFGTGTETAPALCHAAVASTSGST